MRNMKRGFSLFLSVLMVMASLVVALPTTASAASLSDSLVFDLGFNYSDVTNGDAIAKNGDHPTALYNKVSGGVDFYAFMGIAVKTADKTAIKTNSTDGHRVALAQNGITYGTGLTIEMEAYVPSNHGSVVLFRDDKASNLNLCLHEGKIWMGCNDGNDIVTADDSAFPTDEWVHIAATWGPNGEILYINGVEVINENKWAWSAPATSRLGFGLINGSPLGSEGSYSMIRVYKDAASAADLKALYKAHVGFSGSLVFDLGFNYSDVTNGDAIAKNGDHPTALYNKVSGGVDFYAFMGIAVKTADKTAIKTNSTDGHRVALAQNGITYGTGLTIEMEAYVPSNHGSVVLFRDDKASNLNLCLHEGKIWMGCNDGNDIVTADDSAFPTDEWVHIAATWGPNGEILYINGVEVINENKWAWSAPATSRLGFGLINGSPLGSEGSYSMIRVYSDAATAADLKTLWNNYAGFEGSKIFDLGFNYTSDVIGTSVNAAAGAIYNKTYGGIGFYNISGDYEVVAGKNVFHTYEPNSGRRIATTATTGLLDDKGVTAEMEVFIQEDADMAILFRDDKSSNLNLIWTPGTVYIGCDDGSDVTGDGDLIPVGEWVHITVSWGPEGQALYVNGEKVLSGNTWTWAAPATSRLGFAHTTGANVGTKMGYYVAMARLYKAECTEADATSLYTTYRKANPLPQSMEEVEAAKTFDMQINCAEYGRLDHAVEDVRSITNSVTGQGALTIPTVTGAIRKDETLKKPVYYMPATDHNAFLRVAGVRNTNGLTVEMYVNLEDSETNLHTLVRGEFSGKSVNFNLNRWENGNWAGLWLGATNDNDYLISVDSDEANQVDPNWTTKFPTDTWLHVVRVEDTDGMQYLYINGELAYSGNTGFAENKNFWLEFGSVSYYFQNSGGYPSEGYSFSDIRVYDTAVAAHNVKELYKQAVVDNAPDVLGDFTDITMNAWYVEPIRTVVAEGIFGGTSDTTFAPDMAMSRAMFATVLANHAGVDLDDYSDYVETFTDVKQDQWFFEAIAWAYEEGIVNGMTPTTFDPDGKITREQMCVMIIRYLDAIDVTLPDNVQPATDFEDAAQIGSWAIDAVIACNKAGVINGMTPTTFGPTQTATRAQVAKVFAGLLPLLDAE